MGNNLFYVVLIIMQFVVGLGDKVSPTDIEEGMRVGFVLHSSALF
jgi:hypothetical protein